MGIQPAVVSQAPPSGDQANAVVSGAFIATGVSPTFVCWGPFNLFLYGSSGPNGAWAGTVQLQRTFDGGTTWVVCNIDAGFTQAEWATGKDVSLTVGEPEKGMGYRLQCTAYTSGTINYRMSTTGVAALSMSIAASF